MNFEFNPLPAIPLHSRTIVDRGCGTADLHPWLAANGIGPTRYLGVKAFADMVAISHRRNV
ncbi:MAG: hypothetical protein KF866_01295 [Phycisphaeraceae bacterium]|nr:hypothetical protein [Phycisphaeraceae bacterium]